VPEETAILQPEIKMLWEEGDNYTIDPSASSGSTTNSSAEKCVDKLELKSLMLASTIEANY
jgi:hypothetical protein